MIFCNCNSQGYRFAVGLNALRNPASLCKELSQSGLAGRKDQFVLGYAWYVTHEQLLLRDRLSEASFCFRMVARRQLSMPRFAIDDARLF